MTYLLTYSRWPQCFIPGASFGVLMNFFGVVDEPGVGRVVGVVRSVVVVVAVVVAVVVVDDEVVVDEVVA